MSKFVTKLISPWVLCTTIKNRVLSWFDRFSFFYNCMRKNITKVISPRVSSLMSQIVFLTDLTVLPFNKTVWAKLSKYSYLREFCALMSQIVFLADLTVLRLIRTLWARTSQNSYLHEISAQVSNVVFLAILIVLRLFNTVWAKMLQNSYLREFCAQV